MNSSSSTTAIVFARLDPVLKNLLEGLTSLKDLLPSLSTVKSKDDNFETTFVRLSKSIAKDLESISKAIVLASPNQKRRLQHAKALCMLTKYITLPLNAIFRLPLQEIYEPKSQGESQATKDPKLAIRRSYVYKIYRLAAIAMQQFIEETTIEGNKLHTSKNLLPTTTWIEHLVALIHAMPTYSEISGENSTTNLSLDDGTDAHCAILSTTNTLLSRFQQGNDDFNLTTTLFEAWHGTLSMRLVDCLTAFLVCRPKQVFSLRVHSAALETLLTMLRVTKGRTNESKNCDNEKNNNTLSQEFWRSVFPGVFTALYQTIASDATSKSKPSSSLSSSSTTNLVENSKLSLKSLIILLRITLSSKMEGNFASESNCNNDLLAKLNSMAVIANKKSNDDNQNNNDETKRITIDKETSSKEEFFYNQVRNRVEGPLIFLLRQLSLFSQDAIRKDVVLLCQVILFETRHCWGNTDDHRTSLENPMEQIPLELCIGFQKDPSASVRALSRDIIDKYIGRNGANSLTSSPASWMVPRIVELVQKLSALVQRGTATTENGMFGNTTTGTELRTDLNLLAGYLQCLDTTSSGNIEGKEAKAMTTSVCNSIVSSKQLRRGLIQLFGVDLDSLTNKNGSLVSLVIDHKNPSPIKLRHLDHPELMVLARDAILRSLGRLLGPKHGAILVDEIVSDFLEASFQMPKAKNSSNDLVSCWLHEWLGSIIVAREILLGAFSVERTLNDVPNEKKEKRRRRILISLAASILPLLVDCSLWNLPLENQVFTTNDTTKNISDNLLSPQAIQRNQIVVILLMEVIGVFSNLLAGDLKEVLVTIFYAVVEKTTRRGPKAGSDIVEQMGLSTLKIMSLACGLKSTEDLIYTEQNRLISSMIGRLRLPGGSRIPQTRDDAEEILSVTKTSIWVLEMVNRGIDTKINGDLFEEDSEFPKNTAVMDLVSLLNYRLDHLFLQKVLVDSDVEAVCSLHKAFFNYFLNVFQVDREATYSYQMKHLTKESKQPWLDLLSQFHKIRRGVQESDEERKENEGNLLDFAKSDITLLANLIGRNCYLLSYQKLQSRISSCDALTLAFKFLAFVGSEHNDPNDDTNVIRNTILRQVADSWPSIRARLKSLSEVILHSYSGRSSNIVLVLNQSNATTQRGTPEDIGTQRIFLSKVFQLIATMCECSGDFFADRFRNDVWPVMAHHLEYLLGELQRQREAQSSSNVITSEQKLITAIGSSNVPFMVSSRTKFSFKMSDTQRQLVSSILKCLNRILEQEECGKAVGKLLGSIGSTLLPLLDIEDQPTIQDLAMDSIRNILRIDSDVLRRPLMELSGTKIPPCALKFKKGFRRSKIKAVEPEFLDVSFSPYTESKGALVGRCLELLSFADSLPEQAIS